MNYATVQDMQDRFGLKEMISLTDREYAAVVVSAVAEVALTDATNEINGYLSKYPKPFTELPPSLKKYCCDIARYNLTGTDILLTDEIAKRYDQAIQYLEKVANGKISLTTDEGTEAVTNTVVMFSPQQKVFGRDKPY